MFKPDPWGVISLQYADDTLLFLENDRDIAINFKWILTCFIQLSGMRINYHKSELIGIERTCSLLSVFWVFDHNTRNLILC
jgi:hypothetical protein